MPSIQATPPEVWLHIFRFATEDRGSSLERIQLGPNEYSRCWKESAGFRSSLKTKSILVKTCRLWNAVATPLLYQHISIGSDQQYRGALTVFNNGSGLHFRKLVHRLDIVYPQEGKAFETVVELCNLFPKLTTLIASLELREEDEAKPLFDALPPSLKYLYLRSTTDDWELEHVPFSHIVHLLDSHPQMVAISIPYQFRETAEANNVDSTWAGKRWPSLRGLVLQSSGQAKAILSYLPPTAFPNLRTINGSWYGSGGSGELQSVVSPLIGKGLVTLSMSLTSFPGEASKVSHFLRQLETLCPQLRTVHVWPTEFAFTYLDLLGRLSAKAPLITTIGVHLPMVDGKYHPRNMPSRVLQEMHHLATLPWTYAFPNLTTIRLMERVDAQAYRVHDNVTRNNLCSPGRYARHPIRIEDRDGQLLAQFTSGISTLVEL